MAPTPLFDLRGRRVFIADGRALAVNRRALLLVQWHVTQAWRKSIFPRPCIWRLTSISPSDQAAIVIASAFESAAQRAIIDRLVLIPKFVSRALQTPADGCARVALKSRPAACATSVFANMFGCQNNRFGQILLTRFSRALPAQSGESLLADRARPFYDPPHVASRRTTGSLNSLTRSRASPLGGVGVAADERAATSF
jgi:hypothetical protein